ncbi:MAG: protein of unassigned function [Massilia sp.]|nr:protein of unassigned function [Massilia sp.]
MSGDWGDRLFDTHVGGASGPKFALGQEAWEELLVRHYLRSDGPYGGAPLRSIDATPLELARATCLDAITPEASRRSFLACFHDMVATRDVLRGVAVPRARTRETPGYFRYLVLSTLVPALSEDGVSIRDFRLRLGRLLELGGALSALEGLPELWNRLATWCERRRSEGEPYRRIVLPNPGHMRLIGYSVRLAFPSWRDRDRLVREIAHIGPASLLLPRTAIAKLQHPIEFDGYSASMRDAFWDFRERFQRGERLLSEHRFWRLLCDLRASTRESLVHNVCGIEIDLLLVVGLDDADLELELTARRAGEGPDDEREVVRLAGCIDAVLGGVRDLPARVPNEVSSAARDIVEAVRLGVLVFVEEGWGRWSFAAPSAIFSGDAVAIARTDLTRRLPFPRVVWRPAGSSWQISGVLSAGALEALLGLVRQRPADRADELADLEIVGGVPTGRALLGRPRLLPHVRATIGSMIQLQPLDGAEGEISVSAISPDTWALVSKGLVTGAWRVSASEAAGPYGEAPEVERVLRFDARALEHEHLADPDRDPSRLEPEIDMVVRRGAALHAKPLSGTRCESAADAALIDLTEAVYARGRVGWSEADLITLVRQVLRGADAPRPWDVLHVLQVAGWIEPRLLTSWKGRRWYLRPPSIVGVAAGTQAVAVLDGAAPLIVRERFNNVSAKLGAQLAGGGVRGAWSLPVLAVRDIDPIELARLLDIPFSTEAAVDASIAPACWPAEKRTIEHRELMTRWSWERGHFVQASGPPGKVVRLERYSRARADDRDILLLSAPGLPGRIFGSRTAALLEAHRLARRPLFEFRNGALWRRAADGNLPLPVARMFRLAHLAGPFLDIASEGGAASLAYPVDEPSARLVAAWFGAAISIHGARADAEDGLGSIALARHRGRAHRLVWDEQLQDLRLQGDFHA